LKRTRKLFLHLLPLIAGCGLFVLVETNAVAAECPGKVKRTGNDPLRMLVMGDSILWGQGLKQERKAWWRVKCWLEEKTGRAVTEQVLAHSGALLEAVPDARSKFSSRDHEVNLPLPTINQQLDEALSLNRNELSKINLVLVDGCVNDVGVSNLLNAAVTPESLRPKINERCGAGMTALIRRITEGFPNAQVLVTGYYRSISAETDDNAFLRLLVKKLAAGDEPGKERSYYEMRQRLITLSEEWYELSTTNLSNSVSKVNEELSARSQSPRVTFVEIDFWPEHAFAAPQTLLWNFKLGSTNLSGFRQIIVALSFGTAAFKPNDDTRDQRSKSCKETFKKPKGVKETKPEKQLREDAYLTCRYASLGHPNQMGALVYAEAIKGHLQSLLDKTGWIREANAAVR
jgi:lysophospholipase L1-like esterase